MKRHAIALLALLFSAPLSAKVHETAPNGFVLRLGLDVTATPSESWRMLGSPEKWWSEKHSFSGDAANLSLELRAGGCFCEVLPSKISPNAAPRGSVEHMRVIYVEEPRALRMTGALGPLQAGAGQGTLTIFLKPAPKGTRILWEYVYGGYVRGDIGHIAASVDSVLSEQLLSLGRMLGTNTSVPGGMDGAPPKSEPTHDEDDFFREMTAGLEESREANVPEDPVLAPEPPARNDRVFIGR